MTSPNSGNLRDTSPLFGFNDHSSDCVLIVEIEIHLELGGHLRSVASSCCMEEWPGIKKLHVNSVVLAEKSPFFRDLFKHATMESEQRCVALTIHASEETAFTELLNFMYSGTLTSATEPALLDVLKVADKFQVVSCMKLCASLLVKMPMTAEAAVAYLSLVMADEVRNLIDAAKQFVATQPIHVDDHQLEINQLTLAGMEAILSSDTLEFFSEDLLFGVALHWTRTRYPNVEDQRRIFTAHLARHIRFAFMSPGMLKDQVLSCDALDGEFAHKAVVDALYFKITNPHHHHRKAKIVVEEGSTSTSYVRRPYYNQLVRVVEFEFPCPEVVVYLDLSAPVSSLCTEEFTWGPHWFRLFVSAREDRGRFTVHLEADDDSLVEPLAVEYELAARSKCTGKFVSKSSGSLEFFSHCVVYETPLLDFEAGKSLDFIDGVVYLEFKLRRTVDVVR